MNDFIKKTLENSLGAIILAVAGALVSAVFFVLGFILSIRADLNSTQFQVEAFKQSISTFGTVVSEVATLKQETTDTNQKVDALYQYFLDGKK